MEEEKRVDESWKDSIFKEKETPPQPSQPSQPPEASAGGSGESDVPAEDEVNFVGYITSLVFQTMIFLGDIPNPLTNQTEKNINQAKFLIDTLTLLREKTKGNLTKEEENILNGALYELQMRYVELSSGGGGGVQP